VRAKVAAIALSALALAGCGKGDIAFVHRPVLPIYVCKEEVRPCPHPFDAGRLIGLTLPDAEKLAARYHYKVRKVAPGSGDLTMEFLTSRLDVETDSPSRDAIVVRYVERG
jgi:hypothetical protein